MMVTVPAAESQPTTSNRGVILKFQNLRPDANSVPAYVTFGAAGTLVATNLANNTPIVKQTCQTNGQCQTKSYKISDLTAGVLITQFNSGRIYISLGNGLTSSSQANGYSPNFNNPSLCNNSPTCDFTTRWDKIELDFERSSAGIDAGGANLSAQDFFGIPLQISTTGGGKTLANLTWRETSANVFQQLGKLANFTTITLQNATGAIALGNNGVAVPGVTGNVVRVISPASVAPINQEGQTVYPSLSSYISFLRTGGANGQPIQTIIAGHNGQPTSGGPFQVYNLVATISNSTYGIAGTTINPGDLVLTGTVDNADGNGPVATTILARAANLTDTATYGANPAATQIQGKPGDYNKIIEKVTADFFSAINFGLAGSTVDNPAKPGTTIGNSPSWTWFGNNVDGIGQPALPITNAFAYAQPSHPDRYNRYAAYLTSVSDAYGFAYNDRLQSPLAPLGDGSTLTLSMLPDAQALIIDGSSGIGIVNAASFAQGAPVAPGSMAVISGNLPVSAPFVAPGSNVPLPTNLYGMTVQFSGGQYATLFSVAPDSAIVQIPWELQGQTQDSIVVAGNGRVSEPQPLSLALYAPGIFSVDASGTGQGDIYDVNFKLVGESNPATAGQAIVIYCSGLGSVSNLPPTGVPTPLTPLATTLTTPTVYIGGEAATVLYSGLAPGFVGLYQVNAIVPQLSAVGASTEVVIQMGSTISNSVTMAVR